MKNNIPSRTTSGASLSRYILVILCIAVVFTALVLVVLNAWVKNKRLNLPNVGIAAVDQMINGQTYEDGYRAGFLAAREKFATRPPLPANLPVTSANGIITAVSGAVITLKVNSLDTDELVDGVSDIRQVSLASSSTIVSRSSFTQQETEKMMKTWQEEGIKNNLPPPMPFKELNLNFSDLKAGQTISVVTSKDLRLLPTFTATKIILVQ